MALIVEDGTGVVGADTYCSEAAADAYHEAMGNEAWQDVENKEAMLRRATAYMVQEYRARWAGYRIKADQALDWPRNEVPYGDYPYNTTFPYNQVPKEVVNACAELALKANAGELAPDFGRLTKSESVGPISVTYEDGDAGYVRFRAVDAMLEPFLCGGGATVQLVR